MFLLRFGLALSALPFAVSAQSGCPTINFLVSRTVNLKPTAISHISVVRQADGSYTGFELTDLAPHGVISVTPHFERQFAACLPHALPATPSPAIPANVPAISSQLLASEALPSGNYFVASIKGNPYTGPYTTGSLQFDLYDSQLQLLSEANFAAPGQFLAGFASLALADVNGDGKADLIAISVAQSPVSGDSNLNVGFLWIFPGNGDGTFQPGVDYPLPDSFFNPGYSSFAVGDLNGDGKPDLAIATGSGVTAIALGNGNGTFSVLPTTAVPAYPTSSGLPNSGSGYIASADLNGDGKLDLVFGPFRTDAAPSGVLVALGNGDGTFQPPVFLPVRLNMANLGANQIALGDVNQDGIPDIVTAGGTILFGDGKGGFPRRRDYAWNASGSVTLADFDGDGKIDIIVGNGNSLLTSGSTSYPSLTVMFGQGGGAFVGAPISNAGPSGALELGQAIAPADFNRDGIPDLAFVDFEGGFLDILLGAGEGTFRQTFQYSFASTDLPPVSIAIADFNGDGKPDLAVLVSVPPGGRTQGEVEIFLGNGDGTLQPPMSFALPAGNPTFIAAGDFNGDGIPDVAATAHGGVWVWLGKGDGTFSAPTAYSFPNVTLTSVAIGDFNRDGKLDLAVANPGAGNVAMMLGKGDGTFLAGAVTPVSAAIATTGTVVGPAVLIAADFNNDGALDLASILGGQDGGLGGGLAVLLGKGDGSFQALAIDPELAGAIAAGDINGDKIPDLIASDQTLGTVVRIGNGDGTFQPATPVLSTPLYAFAVADFNLDGKLDIAGGMPPTGVATLLNYSTLPSALAVVSAASFLQGPLAPNEIATAFGVDLATATPGTDTVLVHDSAGATRAATFVYFASPGQVNFVIPAATALGAATVLVTSPDGAQSSAQIQIVPLAPALSTVGSTGIAAAYAIRVSPDGTQTIVPVFAAQGNAVTLTPIDLGQPGSVYLLLFGTGFDAASAASRVVNIQGFQVPVQYAGPQASFAGFDQIGVLLPPLLAGLGVAGVQVTIGGESANRVYVRIK
jgi:uncharacterized protein (TIGR03437 family)